MKLEVGTLNNDQIESMGEVTKMRLSENASAMVFRMFTKSVYSDPVGTVIREITSNCFDSHVEAGVDSIKNPVIVELKRDESGQYISFIDKGVGMNPDRVNNIYGTYFKTTKDKTNDQIGGFGIGGKTPLAYTKSFYVVSVSEKEGEIEYCKTEIEKIINALESVDSNGESTYNNEYGSVEKANKTIENLTNRLTSVSNQKEPRIHYVYNIFEGNESPCIELLALKPTDEPKGTEVKVPIAEHNVKEFEEKTLRQLYYFENIIFKGFSDRYVTNDYSIVKGKTFLYRGTTYSQEMHVCIGKVAYPIDWNALGLDQYDYEIPVAVKFDIGELPNNNGVTVSRESLDYSEGNRKILIKKINSVMEELKALLSAQYGNVKTLEEYYHATEDFGKLFFPDGRSIYVGRMISKNDIDFEQFEFKDLKVPTREEILNDFFRIRRFGKKGSRHTRKWNQRLGTMSNWDNIFHVDSKDYKKVNLKQAYLRETLTTFYIVEPIVFTEKEHLTALYRKYGVIKEKLNNVSGAPLQFEVLFPKQKANVLFDKIFNQLYNIIVKTTKSYDDVVVPEDYVEARKNARISKSILKVGIPMKDCSGGWCSNNRLTLNQLINFTGRIYYGFSDHKHELSRCESIFSTLGGKTSTPYYINDKNDRENGWGTMFVSIAKQNEKYMKMLGKKAIHIDFFYNTFITRKVGKVVENKIMSAYENDWNKVEDIFYDENVMPHIDKDIFEVAIKVKKEIKKSKKDISDYINKDLFKKMFNVDLDNLDSSLFTMKKELDWLLQISEKSKRRLQWISIPYRIDLNDEDDKELITMLQLIIEK